MLVGQQRPGIAVAVRLLVDHAGVAALGSHGLHRVAAQQFPEGVPHVRGAILRILHEQAQRTGTRLIRRQQLLAVAGRESAAVELGAEAGEYMV